MGGAWICYISQDTFICGVLAKHCTFALITHRKKCSPTLISPIFHHASCVFKRAVCGWLLSREFSRKSFWCWCSQTVPSRLCAATAQQCTEHVRMGRGSPRWRPTLLTQIIMLQKYNSSLILRRYWRLHQGEYHHTVPSTVSMGLDCVCVQGINTICCEELTCVSQYNYHTIFISKLLSAKTVCL